MADRDVAMFDEGYQPKRPSAQAIRAALAFVIGVLIAGLVGFELAAADRGGAGAPGISVPASNLAPRMAAVEPTVLHSEAALEWARASSPLRIAAMIRK